jgi:transposase
MSTLAEVVDAVIGVDTHLDENVFALANPAGAVLARLRVPNDAAGHAAALAWAGEHACGPRTVFAVEGTRSHGIGLARALAAAGQTVVEVERPRRAGQARRGKSDDLDAAQAACAALRAETHKLAIPRADGLREALRLLLGAREEMSDDKTAKTNRLRAVLLTGDEDDRALARQRRPLGAGQLDALARRRPRRGEDAETAVRRQEVRRLAAAIRGLARDLAANKAVLAAHVTAFAPAILSLRGVGPVTAAQAIVAYSHRGRIRSEAAFARLAGVAPLEAASGRVERHRLSRAGDRKLNQAIHAIAVTRTRCCERTRAYIARRRAEGKNDREIRRCLKRYIARELYRHLDAHTAA